MTPQFSAEPAGESASQASRSPSGQATIVGAGLVGSLLAVLLARRGWAVSVYEKRPDMRRVRIPAGRSINLALAERGISSLRNAGLLDQIKPLLIPMRGRCVHHRDGRVEFVPYGQRPHEVIYSVSRLLLNQTLMSAAESTGSVRIEFNQLCTAVDLEQKHLTVEPFEFETASAPAAAASPATSPAAASGVTRPSAAVGSSASSRVVPFELLLGADGAASVIRDTIVAQARSRLGSPASATLAAEQFPPMLDFSPLDHDYKELSIPASATGQFQMRPDALHIWPRGGYMLIALPNLDRSFTVTLFLPKSGSPGFDRLTSAEAVQQFFREQFPDAFNLMGHLVEEFFGHPTGQLGTIYCWPWAFEDRALVMGDAAHAIVPFHGQGMNAGFEDADCFATMLDAFHGTCGELLTAFQQRRKPNADAIAQMALENYIDMRDAAGRPNFPLRKALEFELEQRHPDRFIPRYSMVMFHRIDYAQVLRRGAVQQDILDELLSGGSDLNSVDWELAAQLINERLMPVQIDDSVSAELIRT